MISRMLNRGKLEKSVRDFRERLCAEYCVDCSNNCCSGRLNPNVAANFHFRSFPVLRNSKDKTDQPYILKKNYRESYLVGACPYLKNNLCSIHASKERPRDCRLYPLYLAYPFSIKIFYPFLQVETGCKIFEEAENYRKVFNFAAKLGLEIHFS